MRGARAVVALLVVLAGCNALAPDRPTESTTPSPNAPTGTATPRDVGLTADGVTDPWRLRTAHRRALDDRSYTYAFRLAVRRKGTTRGVLEGTYRVSANRSRYLFTQNVDGDVPAWLVVATDLRRYRADGRVVVQRGEDRATEVLTTSRGSGTSKYASASREIVYLLLSDVDTDVTGTVTRDGDTYYRVAGTAATWRTATDVTVSALIRRRESSGRSGRRTPSPRRTGPNSSAGFASSGAASTGPSAKRPFHGPRGPPMRWRTPRRVRPTGRPRTRRVAARRARGAGPVPPTESTASEWWATPPTPGNGATGGGRGVSSREPQDGTGFGYAPYRNRFNCFCQSNPVERR